MQVDGKTLTIGRELWVQYGGVDVAERGGRVSLTGRDEDAYLKVLNHFGRVLKLYTFEGGRWVDAATGAGAQPFDESQAGRLPVAPAAAGRAARPAGRKPAARSPAKAPARTPAAAAEKPASRKVAARPAAKPAAGGAAKPKARPTVRAKSTGAVARKGGAGRRPG